MRPIAFLLAFLFPAVALAMPSVPSDLGVVGAYITIDEDRTDVNAQIACDDDGDYVVVMTTAMVDLMDRTASSLASGEPSLGVYVTALRSQPKGAPLLPVPAGVIVALDPETTSRRHAFADAMMAFVVYTELSHANVRIVCPHPTIAHESGDVVWTESERALAATTAKTLYAAQSVRSGDTETASRMAAWDERGPLALLYALGGLEVSGASTYTRTHTGSLARMAAFRRAIETHRQQ